jgi:hypothetical protein
MATVLQKFQSAIHAPPHAPPLCIHCILPHMPPPLQAMSWQDGYECYGTEDVDKIAASSEQNHPILVLLAHDGDNAFGGGNSYYTQCVMEFVDSLQEKVRS